MTTPYIYGACAPLDRYLQEAARLRRQTIGAFGVAIADWAARRLAELRSLVPSRRRVTSRLMRPCELAGQAASCPLPRAVTLDDVVVTPEATVDDLVAAAVELFDTGDYVPARALARLAGIADAENNRFSNRFSARCQGSLWDEWNDGAASVLRGYTVSRVSHGVSHGR